MRQILNKEWYVSSMSKHFVLEVVCIAHLKLIQFSERLKINSLKKKTLTWSHNMNGMHEPYKYWKNFLIQKKSKGQKWKIVVYCCTIHKIDWHWACLSFNKSYF